MKVSLRCSHCGVELVAELKKWNCRIRRALCAAALICVIVCALAAEKSFYPQAGDKTVTDGGATIDVTNAGLGYIRVMCKKTTKKLKVRIALDKTTLTYDLNGEGEFEVFPLQLGSGTYTVTVYKQASGNEYTSLLRKKIKVTIPDELSPFLCPNQYVWYTTDSVAVARAAELCEGLNDKQKCETVFDFVRRNVMYDFFAAMSVKTGYLPDVDTTLSTGKGICFDYAALMCAMLRSQSVPCQLVIGYADKTYHAWVSVYIDGEWVRYDPTFASTGAKADTYTTERWY